MVNVVMPEQIIKGTYGEIPNELINVEKLLEEAGFSGASKAPHRERPKLRSEKDLINSLIHDLGKEDLEDRFVKLQMVNQEREEQLERQQYQIEHLTKFLKQADETLRDAITVAERDARIEIRSAADSSLRECLREIKNLKEQNSRLEREGINARNAYRYVKATLKDLTNYRVEVSWATQLHGHGELAKRIYVQRRNRIARAIRNAHNEMVKEDEDSGGSTPEQHSDDEAP